MNSDEHGDQEQPPRGEAQDGSTAASPTDEAVSREGTSEVTDPAATSGESKSEPNRSPRSGGVRVSDLYLRQAQASYSPSQAYRDRMLANRAYSGFDATAISHATQVFANHPALRQMTETLSRWSVDPDSSAGRMLRELAMTSEQVAKIAPPSQTQRSLSAAIQTMADRNNPALRDLGIASSAAAQNAALSPFASALSKVVTESSIFTKALIDSEGTTGALQRILQETAAAQQRLRTPPTYTELMARGTPQESQPGSVLSQMIASASHRQHMADLYEQMLTGTDRDARTAEEDLERLTDDLDAETLSDLTEFAIEDADFENRAAFYQRLEDAAPQDLDEFERIAKEVLEEEGLSEELTDDDTADGDLTPREALLALAVAQFPDIAISREDRKRIDLYVHGSGILFYAYLRVFQPGFYIFLATLLEVLGFMSALRMANNHLLDPVTKDEREDEPEDDET
ncbi:hypothetical protein GXB85_05390 [Cellulomonas sp. APG4]|uniref:hypothetical protein n=1 Tax=Cellulomonas sp. APG4 TaxID=1538656 RepID=UPI0013797DDE|nr:hypothetical protein [Cellulomonas sp. APG4]NCT90385.1 hypothetical protein [Cellulomonas sp. APG4]